MRLHEHCKFVSSPVRRVRSAMVFFGAQPLECPCSRAVEEFGLQSSRVLKTASFKLAAVYVVLFGISVAVLGAIIYFTATAALDHQERTRLQSEAEALLAEYRRDGFEELMEEIRARARSQVAGGFDYTVLNQSGARVFGDIPRFGLKAGWTHLKRPTGRRRASRGAESVFLFIQCVFRQISG